MQRGEIGNITASHSLQSNYRRKETEISMNCFTRLYKRVVVLTGAGVSTASGLPTYRGQGGLWSDPETARFTTPRAFAKDPDGAWKFWSTLREHCLKAEPNPGHLALSDWGRKLNSWEDRSFTLITQNVDGLHERAGSHDAITMHGSILHSRCTNDTCDLAVFEDRELFFKGAPRCPECKSVLRPDVVLFDEAIPAKAEWLVRQALRNCDLFIAVGTSGTVSPAAGFVNSAKYVGATTLLVNLEPMESVNKAFDLELLGKAESLLPRLEVEFFYKQVMFSGDLPPASRDREEYAHQRFNMALSPEEQAAREAHTELLGGLDSVRYADPQFDAWVHRYYAVVCAQQYLNECRRKYLTEAELEAVSSDDGL